MKTILRTSILFLFIGILLNSCKEGHGGITDKVLWKRAVNICETNLILDSHNDWPTSIHFFPEDISTEIQKGDFDFIRAKEGGLDAAFSVVYISARYSYEEGRLMVDTLLNLISDITKKYPDKFAPATKTKDIRTNADRNLISLPTALENGLPIGKDLEYLKYLRKYGIQYITLTHIKDNQISDSNGDTSRTWNGLSPFGFEVIEEMNRLAIMVDISHSSDSAAFQAMNHSKAPVIASHSSCRHFTPNYERNLSDTLIKSIAKTKGVIMVNFGSQFLDSLCQKNWQYILDWYDSTGVDEFSDEGIAFAKNHGQTHKLYANSDDLIKHIDYIVNLVGIDFVGIGSDFNGIGYSQPYDLPDVTAYPMIVYKLLKRDYSESDIKQILAENYLRVWNDVISISDSLNLNYQ